MRTTLISAVVGAAFELSCKQVVPLRREPSGSAKPFAPRLFALHPGTTQAGKPSNVSKEW